MTFPSAFAQRGQLLSISLVGNPNIGFVPAFIAGLVATEQSGQLGK